MKKNLYRFIGAFVALLGLAYLGHQVFLQGSGAPKAPESAKAAPAAAAPAAPSAPAVAKNAYAVYPDAATDSALGLSYPSFSGDFAHNVTVTPLPPNTAGVTAMRMIAQKGHKIDIALNDTRCAAPVHVVVSKIDDKHAIESRDLSGSTPKFSIPFPDGSLPPLLIEMKMDDKAANNYYCGVTVVWSE